MRELVLLGGGHAHVEVLRRWRQSPLPDTRLTLVGPRTTPYSGMLPGYVAGLYSLRDVHIDLERLAAHPQMRHVVAEASGIDVQARRVLFAARAPVPYDVLSINTGIMPAAAAVPGAAAHTTPVKPIHRFVERFDALLQRVVASQAPLSVAIVGGGAAGVELALALAHRLQQERTRAGAAAAGCDRVMLFCRGRILQQGHPLAVAAALRSLAAARGVALHENSAVLEVQQGRLRTEDGVWHAFTEALWCTQATAAPWLKDTGLPVDECGFLRINEFLQSDGGPPEVFAAGDCASSTLHPRPKAGVFAVRQGPPLSDNLRRFLIGQPLKRFVPQAQALALISAGDRYAVGTRGSLTVQGRWVWQLKDYIDRSFMGRYAC